MSFPASPPSLASLAEASETTRLKSLLRQVGLKATEARLAVLGSLLAASKPVSHPELTRCLQEKQQESKFEATSEAKPLETALARTLARTLDRATIYRNLMDLVEKGLAERVHYGDSVWRFRFHAHSPHAAASELALKPVAQLGKPYSEASTELDSNPLPLSQHQSQHAAQQHPHFVCQTCQAVLCLPEPQAVNQYWALYSQQLQGIGKVEEILLKGLCFSCQ